MFTSNPTRLPTLTAWQLLGWLGLVILFTNLSGCGHLFFLPTKEEVLTPDQIGLAYEDITVFTPDGQSLHGWLLHARGELAGRSTSYMAMRKISAPILPASCAHYSQQAG